MSKFKIGDWVVCRDYGGNEYFRKYEIDLYYTFKSVKPWRPKIGEWCWFWNHDTDVPNFLMFSHITEDNLYAGNVCKGGVDIEFDYCEPFMGVLPSFVKDN